MVANIRRGRTPEYRSQKTNREEEIASKPRYQFKSGKNGVQTRFQKALTFRQKDSETPRFAEVTLHTGAGVEPQHVS